MAKCGKGCMPECEYFTTGGCISPFNCMYKEESGYINSATSGKIFYTGGMNMTNEEMIESLKCVIADISEQCEQLKAENAELRALETYKQEYRLAAAANRQLADALDKAREENKMLRLQIFAFVRNSAVLPVGICLHKSEQEITDKTFEVIEAAKGKIDVEAVKAAMNLATKRENRFNNAD